MRVPFLDLKIQYESMKDEVSEALESVLESCAFANGPFVASFEQEFASYCQCSDAVGVGSGTDALWLALMALGIGEGDEVITVPNTFIATVEAVSFCGATPVFVDVDEETLNMDPDLLETAITPRTKAIIPVHLFGQMADMDPIMGIAGTHGLKVIEDACQAHGAEYKGRRAGSIGDVGCFSFYPGKNLGAYGEAGAVVTNDASVALSVRRLRDHGQAEKYQHEVIGWNGRMDGFQGAILEKKLEHLPSWTDARRRHAEQYGRILADVEGVTLPFEEGWARHVFHVYAIRVQRRNELVDWLGDREVHCGIHYPVPVHLQRAYSMLGYSRGSFPVAEMSAEQLVSLPMFPELTETQIVKVASEIRSFASKCGRVEAEVAAVELASAKVRAQRTLLKPD